ncbi:hypothetical protein ACUH9Y_02200 [Dermabacteraceae bacterium P13115]|nr:hypothetical protein [Dermabacteraceae bacterium TAE3-ERU27]MBV7433173.1 hypothetical protein [Dermabacteraceae bacterium TAE3-ERU5]
METTPLFEQENMTVLNLGLEVFNDAVNMQGATGVHIDWRPPAGGNLRLIEIIERLKELG